MDVNAIKGGFQLFPPSVVEIAQVVEGSQCLGEVDQRQAGVEYAAGEADDEGRWQRAGLLGDRVDVAHELRGEVHRGRLGVAPGRLSGGG